MFFMSRSHPWGKGVECIYIYIYIVKSRGKRAKVKENGKAVEQEKQHIFLTKCRESNGRCEREGWSG